nr:putative PEP-binding protein [Waterburya agarophytonicola]
MVGNQLYILSQLLQHESAILPGFVLGNNLLSQFLTNLDDFQSLVKELSDSSIAVDVNDSLSLQSVASRSRHIVDRGIFPQPIEQEIFEAAQQLNSNSFILQPFFSSPSGQDLSSRGFWRSHFCNAHPQALTRTIKKVWLELFSAKSLLYWKKLGLSGETINLGILVRPAIDALASGTVEISPDLIRIKAVWGQERSLLQGDVDSDEYYLDGHTGHILSRKLGHKNYGYRLKEIGLKMPSLSCLEEYIPGEDRSKVYVLEQDAIANLFQSIPGILAKQPQIKYLQWIATNSKVPGDSRLNFFFTQFSDRLLTSINLPPQQITPLLASSPAIKPLLTGISAAPGRVTGRVVIVEDFSTQPESIPEDTILAISEISLHHIPWIDKAKGIITEIGGKNSHGAIIARELNIPAVVGAVDATKILSNGLEICLSGDEGKVYPKTELQHRSLSNLSAANSSSRHQLIATKLMVNISQLQSIPLSLNLPVDGVGLLRSELMLGHILAGKSAEQWQSKSFQTEFTHILTTSLREFVKAFAPRPIYYRSLDWTTQNNINSVVGNRGSYSYGLDSTLFSLELKALLAIAKEGYSNLHLVLPFVRSVEEFQFCYRQLENIGLAHRESFQIWIMAEVPSVMWLLPEYIKAGVRGIAIGTNDLTQLLLGVDREQAHFSHNGLNANHSVVQKAIAQLIAIAKENNIDCSICGQAPVEYPDLIDRLVGWGINTISVEPEAVNRTYRAIARAERRILLNSVKSS